MNGLLHMACNKCNLLTIYYSLRRRQRLSLGDRHVDRAQRQLRWDCTAPPDAISVSVQSWVMDQTMFT